VAFDHQVGGGGHSPNLVEKIKHSFSCFRTTLVIFATRLRDLAEALDVTERTACGIVGDLADAGYLVKEKDGRRNRYHIQAHLPLPDPVDPQRTIGEILDLLVDANQRDCGRPRSS
jgi:hypothetical protein